MGTPERELAGGRQKENWQEDARKPIALSAATWAEQL